MHGCLEPPMKISRIYVQSWQSLNQNRGRLNDDRLKGAIDKEKSPHRSNGDRTTNELVHSPQMSYRGPKKPKARGMRHLLRLPRLGLVKITYETYASSEISSHVEDHPTRAPKTKDRPLAGGFSKVKVK